MSSSVSYGPAAVSIHTNVAGSLAGTLGVVAMDVVQQGGSYAGGHGGTLVDSTSGQIGSHTGQLNGQRGDAVVYLSSCIVLGRL